MFDETSIRIDWHKENAALKYVHLNVFSFSPAIFKWAPDRHRQYSYIQFDLIRLLDWFLIVVSCVHVRMAGILILCGQMPIY